MSVSKQHQGIALGFDPAGSISADNVQDAIEELDAAIGTPAGVVPLGAIIMWSGTVASIPADWAFCDGTANSPGPDLRDKFIVGAKQDDAGVAKTNIEGSLKVSATQTGASVANHTGLTHANAAVGNHTGLSHDGAVASHPDLTHAALSHPALTVVHADHSVASGSHTHASGADVSVPSGSIASRADLSRASHAHASAANASAPSATFASTNAVSVPSATAASGADHTAPAIASKSGVTITGTVTRSVVTTGGLVLTQLSSAFGANAPSYASQTGVSYPSHTHASAANASAPSGTIASTNAVSVPSATFASSADVSMPSLTIASSAGGSRPSLTGAQAAVTLTHADHSLASLSHQAIGTHANLSHAFTPPADHGAAGVLTHSVTQPDAHAISAHSTVAIVPAYFALAFIQRMA